MQRSVLIWTVAFLFAAAWAFPSVSSAKETKEDENPKIGQPAPQFELTDTEGKVHKLADLKGQVVVLHFQSCTCPWEVAYQPILNKLAQKFGPEEKDGQTIQRVQFLGINANSNESVEQVARDIKKKSIAYPVLKDVGNVVADQYDARTTPHVFVIDADQVLRYKGGLEKAPVSPDDCGKSEEQYLEPAIQALLSGSEPPVTSSMSKGCTIKRERKS